MYSSAPSSLHWHSLSFVLSTSHNKTYDELVIMSHGRTSSKESRTYTTLEKELNSIGYDTCRFDLFGHWDSSWTLDEFTILQGANDYISIYEHAMSLWYSSFIFLGSSISWASCIRACIGKNNISRLILMAPWNKHAHYQELNLLAQKINIPCFIVHGSHDKVVPIHTSHWFLQHLPYAKMCSIMWSDHLFTGNFFDIRASEVVTYLSKTHDAYTSCAISWIRSVPLRYQKARALLINVQGDIWIMYLSNHNHHIIAWWTLEWTEDLLPALEREIREETGYTLSSPTYLWSHEMYRDRVSCLDASVCYINHVQWDPSYEVTLTEKEISQWLELRRYSPQDIMQTLLNDWSSSRTWYFFTEECKYYVSLYLRTIS